MGILGFILIVVLSIFSALLLIALFVYFKIKIMLRKAGIKNIFKEIKDSSDEINGSPKSVGGMTKLLEPIILRDFKSFNKEELFNRCEKNLRTIFGALENFQMSDFKDMPLLYDIVKKQIEDMQSEDIKVSYDDIVFNNFSIRDYKKEASEAIVDIGVSVRYDYKKYKKNKLVKHKEDYQTRYLVKFIYIINEELFTKSKKVYGITCPNCGAAVKALGDKTCAYCGAIVHDINLKAWYMSSYKEY